MTNGYLMKNCLIMGFGRSGTSLMGGILHQAGYYMGDNLYPPRDSNPKGFFECGFINGINEKILQPYDFYLQDKSFPDLGKPHSPYCPGKGHRWLSYISKEAHVTSNDESVSQDIKKAINVQNFAYKDPRFNYTLDAWLPYLKKDIVFICMFRDTADTIESIILESARAKYLANFAINYQIAEQLWINSYNHLFRKLNQGEYGRNFFFIHYNQLLSGSVIGSLSNKLEINIDDSFVDPSLNRTRSNYKTSINAQSVFKTLCKLADYNPGDF